MLKKFYSLLAIFLVCCSCNNGNIDYFNSDLYKHNVTISIDLDSEIKEIIGYEKYIDKIVDGHYWARIKPSKAKRAVVISEAINNGNGCIGKKYNSTTLITDYYNSYIETFDVITSETNYNNGRKDIYFSNFVAPMMTVQDGVHRYSAILIDPTPEEQFVRFRLDKYYNGLQIFSLRIKFIDDLTYSFPGFGVYPHSLKEIELNKTDETTIDYCGDYKILKFVAQEGGTYDFSFISKKEDLTIDIFDEAPIYRYEGEKTRETFSNNIGYFDNAYKLNSFRLSLNQNEEIYLRVHESNYMTVSNIEYNVSLVS